MFYLYVNEFYLCWKKAFKEVYCTISVLHVKSDTMSYKLNLKSNQLMSCDGENVPDFISYQ